MTEVRQEQVVRLRGKCEYANVLPGLERTPHKESIEKGAASPNDRHYQISIECNPATFAKIKAAGLNHMHNLKYKPDGTTWLTVKSTKYKEKTKKGPITFQDPAVVDANGNPFTQNIGNGSEVLVEAVLEQAGVGKALRLRKVTVLQHIPYVKPEVETTTLVDETGTLPTQTVTASEVIDTSTGEVLSTNDVF